jgi:hypothetical protein
MALPARTFSPIAYLSKGSDGARGEDRHLPGGDVGGVDDPFDAAVVVMWVWV